MPRRTIVWGFVAALVAAMLVAQATGAPPRPSVPGLEAVVGASRIVDKTFACAPIAYGGVGDLDVSVSPPRDYGTFEIAPHLTVRTGGFNPEFNLVVVRARPQSEIGGWRAGPAGVYVNSRRCAPARTSLPLSSRGLAGPPTLWEKELDCPVAGRVLVRVRSILRAPANWRRVDRFFDGARQPVVETKLSVRLQRTGKPVAYMEHDTRGATKLWYSSGCS
jgi:hypothetical protein